LLEKIDREIDNAARGKPAHIIVKINALTEPQIIHAFYRASIAGVRIDLIIRGICDLRPGINGVSDNIHVRSIVGRFLEHTRVYYFENGGEPEIYASSADLMERNLFQRVEVCFPISGKDLQARIVQDLQYYLSDNKQAWILNSDGMYSRAEITESDQPVSAQSILLDDLAQQS
jgi:polyphosphate kinase